MAQLVSETYAQALFDAALELDSLKPVYADFGEVVGVFQNDPTFLELFRTPKIDKVEKKQIVDRVFKDNIQLELLNFLKVLVDKRRTYNLLEIYQAFERLYRNHFKIQKAIIKTVVPLSVEQTELLKLKLQQMTGSTVEISNVLDANIVGGMLIQMGDQILDGSLKRKLEGLKESLSQLSL